MEKSADRSSSAADNLPFPRSYWADPEKLLAGCYPGADASARAERKLAGLLRCGVSCVVNLMEEGEKDHAGRPFIPYRSHLETLALERGAPVLIHHFPIVDQNVPSNEVMKKILGAIDASIAGGGVVYVHCWGGRGRTGTVIGCYLLRHRLVPEGGALERLTALTEHQSQGFWPTPQTSQQRQFVSKWKRGE